MVDMDNFMNDLKEIKAECERTSTGTCSAGGCIYSTKESNCLFDCLGLDCPHTWTLGGNK